MLKPPYKQELLWDNSQMYFSKESACPQAHYNMPFLINWVEILHTKLLNSQLSIWIWILKRDGTIPSHYITQYLSLLKFCFEEVLNSQIQNINFSEFLQLT